MPLRAPVRLTAMTRSQSSERISAIIARTVVPAPFTRISIPPAASAMAAARAVKTFRSATSTACAAALPPFRAISAPTSLPASAARSRTATRAPAAAKARHVAAPIPFPPPVTRATFPAKSWVIAVSPDGVRRAGSLQAVGIVANSPRQRVRRTAQGASRAGEDKLDVPELRERRGRRQRSETRRRQAVRLHRDAEPGTRRCMEAAEAAARAHDAPAAAGAFEGLQGDRPADARRRVEDQGERAVRLGERPPATAPDELFAPHQAAAILPGAPLRQHEVELPGVERLE